MEIVNDSRPLIEKVRAAGQYIADHAVDVVGSDPENVFEGDLKIWITFPGLLEPPRIEVDSTVRVVPDE